MITLQTYTMCCIDNYNFKVYYRLYNKRYCSFGYSNLIDLLKSTINQKDNILENIIDFYIDDEEGVGTIQYERDRKKIQSYNTIEEFIDDNIQELL